MKKQPNMYMKHTSGTCLVSILIYETSEAGQFQLVGVNMANRVLEQEYYLHLSHLDTGQSDSSNLLID